MLPTLNRDNLYAMIKDNYISVQKHPAEDLFIYNYTQKCQFDKVWNEETMQCRGLIMDGKNNIVARPFKKFFNVEELETIPPEDFEVFDKWDGSLGILYWVGVTPYIATRGSFVSDQAIKGTELLHMQYGYLNLKKDYTYLFEIIYPGNRIVVDYKGMEGLVLLSVIHTKSGKELSYEEIKKLPLNCPVVKRYDGVTDISTIRHKYSQNNAEGFVIRFTSGLRVKIKYDEYVRLHRLITGINARHIWENLKEDKGIEEMIDHVPDEFMIWVKDTADKLKYKFDEVEEVTQHVADYSQRFKTRKEQAAYIMKATKQWGVVFAMLDHKDYKKIIWKLLKPAHEVPFKKEI